MRTRTPTPTRTPIPTRTPTRTWTRTPTATALASTPAVDCGPLAPPPRASAAAARLQSARPCWRPSCSPGAGARRDLPRGLSDRREERREDVVQHEDGHGA